MREKLIPDSTIHRCPSYGFVWIGIALWLQTTPIQSQNRVKADSLQQAASRQPDSLRVWTLTKLAWEYRMYDRNRALTINQEALALARRRTDNGQIGFCWMAIGNVYCYYKNNPEALESYQNALGYFSKTQDRKRLAQVQYNIGILYHENLDDSPKAIRAYLEAARLGEKERKWGLLSDNYNAIANLLFEQHEEEKAVVYYKKALLHARQSGEPDCVVTVINDYYSNNLSWYARRPDKNLLLEAIRGLEEGIGLCGKHPDIIPPQFLPTLQANLGNCYLLMGNTRRAEVLLTESTRRSIPIHYDLLLPHNYSLLAEIALQSGRTKDVDRYLQKAGEKLKEQEFQNQVTALTRMVDISRRRNDWARAFRWQDQLQAARDSLTNQARHRAVSSLTMGYEVEKKEASIRELEHQTANQQKILWLAIAVGLLLTGLVALAYRSYRLQHRLNEIQQTSFDTELAQKQRVLTANTLNLDRKNELLVKLKQSLQSSFGQTPTIRPTLKPALLLIDKNLRLDGDFEPFRQHFEAMHPAFFQNLRSQSISPLSITDLRYCAYLRMDLSTKEMATLFNIDPQSIRVAKHRLKQKIGLGKTTDLEGFIRNL